VRQLETLIIPKRNDSMPDLQNVQAFIELNRLNNRTLHEFLVLAGSEKNDSAEVVLLRRTIYERKKEIISNFISILSDEQLTVNEAISLTRDIESFIYNAKISR
jgi:hypothetical protein